MLTEQEVTRSWRKLFSHADLNDDIFAKAEALIDELRPESPLRQRLGSELIDLRKRRKLNAVQAAVGKAGRVGQAGRAG